MAGSGKSTAAADLVVTDAVKRCWRVEGEDETQVEAAQPAIKKNGSLRLEMRKRREWQTARHACPAKHI
jgi:hypothetical protein